MKKSGFTLVELLAVITILSVIALITVPIITGSISNSKENLYRRQVDTIEDAAKRYVSDNAMSFDDNRVSVQLLKDEGYLKKDDIKNPKTKRDMDGCVNIIMSGKKTTYTYSESC